MKLTILIGGTKGGSGKSTISALLAKGIADLGHSAAIVTTDMDEEMFTDNKNYLLLDGRGENNSRASLSKIANFDEGNKIFVTIIDGAASDDLETDIAYAEISDLILFPFKTGNRDMTRVRKNLQNMPKAYGLPNEWPEPKSSTYGKVMAKFEHHLYGFRSQILIDSPVLAVSASDELTNEDYKNNTRVNKVSRALAIHILKLKGINPFELEHSIQAEVANV